MLLLLILVFSACRYVGQGITVSESQEVSSIPVFLVFSILNGSVLGRSRLRLLASIKVRCGVIVLAVSVMRVL
ncbi:hypothetical protein C8R41DRAFT_834186 [Lentinula lateritia]|uniref:Uncharacterized protein n=1 Tax=Lentinula lateritia TaxID=40482 RepID=A0ABQ8VE81_9AGAR|nr:hypothetical protein C8R41DRAFT_834186 [Lentinula lateritia]